MPQMISYILSDTEWTVYKAGAVNMKIYPLNLYTEELDDPKMLRVNVGETVRDIKYRISLLLGSSDPIQVCILYSIFLSLGKFAYLQ